jgi:hypothetical protein
MARPKLDYDKAARALVDAVVMGDKAAAERHGVSVNAVEKWRQRAKTDEKLTGAYGRMVDLLRERQDEYWLSAVPPVFKKVLRKISEALDDQDTPLEDLVKHAETLGRLSYTTEYLTGASGSDRDRASDPAEGAAGQTVTPFPQSG